MYSKFLGILVLVASAVACDDAAPTAPSTPLPAAAGAAAHRSMSGKFAGTSAFVAPCAQPGSMLIDVRGTGVASHMGATKVELSGCLAMTQTGFEAVGVGVGRMIAANGDTIRFNSTSTEFDLVSGTARITYVVDGGSGRFQSATGELLTVGQLLPDGAWTNELTGWIGY